LGLHSKYLNPNRSPPNYLPSRLHLILLIVVKSMHLWLLFANSNPVVKEENAPAVAMGATNGNG
jgi:hypothetical protein